MWTHPFGQPFIRVRSISIRVHQFSVFQWLALTFSAIRPLALLIWNVDELVRLVRFCGWQGSNFAICDFRKRLVVLCIFGVLHPIFVVSETAK